MFVNNLIMVDNRNRVATVNVNTICKMCVQELLFM